MDSNTMYTQPESRPAGPFAVPPPPINPPPPPSVDEDIAAVFERLLSERIPTPQAQAMEALTRGIRQKSRDDPSGLAEVTFGAIISFGTELLLRCQLCVGRQLRKHDQFASDGALPVPLDVVRGD